MSCIPTWRAEFKLPLASWMTEGGPIANAGNATKFGRQEVQNVVQMLGAGVTKMTLDAGAFVNDAAWDTFEVFKALSSVTTFFPTAGHVTLVNTGDPRFVEYRRTDPSTGRKTYALWAKDWPMGSGQAAGPDFTVTVGRPFKRVIASSKNRVSPSVADISRKRAFGIVSSGTCQATPRSRSA